MTTNPDPARRDGLVCEHVTPMSADDDVSTGGIGVQLGLSRSNELSCTTLPSDQQQDGAYVQSRATNCPPSPRPSLQDCLIKRDVVHWDEGMLPLFHQHTSREGHSRSHNITMNPFGIEVPRMCRVPCSIAAPSTAHQNRPSRRPRSQTYGHNHLRRRHFHGDMPR